MARFLYPFKDNMMYNTVTRPYIQDGKKRYRITFTLSLDFDEDEIVQMIKNAQNWHDKKLHVMSKQVEKEKKNVAKELKEREEKIKKMKSKV